MNLGEAMMSENSFRPAPLFIANTGFGHVYYLSEPGVRCCVTETGLGIVRGIAGGFGPTTQYYRLNYHGRAAPLSSLNRREAFTVSANCTLIVSIRR